MTAQRTTLISLCLLAITLVFNPPDGPIELLQSGVKVKYPYALVTLMVLISVNGLSYCWRFYSEYKELDLSRVTTISNEAMKYVEEFRAYKLDGNVPRNIESLQKYFVEAERSGDLLALKQMSKLGNKIPIKDGLNEVRKILSSNMREIGRPSDSLDNFDEFELQVNNFYEFAARAQQTIAKFGQLDMQPHAANAVVELADRSKNLADSVERQVTTLHSELVRKPNLGNTRDKLFDYWLPAVLAVLSVLAAGIKFWTL